MHTVDELQEMMELRKQMEALQLRYKTILERPLKKGADTPPAAPPPAPEKPAPTPAAPAPTPVTPEPTPVVVTPTPTPDTPADKPAEAAPPAPAPDKPAAEAAAPSAPAAPPTPPTPPAPAGNQPKPGSLRDAITTVLKAADKPLNFDEIFAALEAGGHKLPEQKPKLMVRKTLFNKAAFTMVGKDKAGQGQYEAAS